jgi:hypothetical protein
MVKVLDRMDLIDDEARARFVAMAGPRYDRKSKVLSLTSNKYPCRMMNQRHVVNQMNQLINYAINPELFVIDYEKTMAGNVDPIPLKPYKAPRGYSIDESLIESTRPKKVVKPGEGEWVDSEDEGEEGWDSLSESDA